MAASAGRIDAADHQVEAFQGGLLVGGSVPGLGSPGASGQAARYLIDVARGHAARHQDTDSLDALLQAELLAAEEVRMHRLTRSVLTDLLGRERRTRTPALRPMAARCGVLERA